MLGINDFVFDEVQGYGIFDSLQERENKKTHEMIYSLTLKKMGSPLTFTISHEQYQTFVAMIAQNKLVKGRTYHHYVGELEASTDAVSYSNENGSGAFVSNGYSGLTLVTLSDAEAVYQQKQKEREFIAKNFNK